MTEVERDSNLGVSQLVHVFVWLSNSEKPTGMYLQLCHGSG